MVPVNLREIIIQTFHALAHPNPKETTRRISEFYYWPRLKKSVEDFCSSCHACQSVKPGNIQPKVGKFPIPDKRFSHLHLDVVGPLPESRGFKYLLSIYDRASRHYECVPMTEATSEATCHAFLHGWVQRYGLPESACSDNGVNFLSRLWKDLQETLNIKVSFVPFYHQATNGAVERAHGTLKNGIKTMLVEMGQEFKQDWFLHLPWVLLSRRVALQPDIGTSSSKLVLGMDPLVPGPLVGAPSPPMSLENLKGLASHLESAADFTPKEMSNHHTKPKKEYMPPTTETATHVYLKRDNPKGLMASYTGPHPIVERPSHSTIKVKVGTFKSGIENIQLHHWANAKPANVRADQPEAQMPVRGRPRKTPATAQSEVQTPTDSEAANLRKNAKSKQPTRQSERIRARNHQTSITECRQLSRPPPGFENVIPNAGNSNAFIDVESN